MIFSCGRLTGGKIQPPEKFTWMRRLDKQYFPKRLVDCETINILLALTDNCRHYQTGNHWLARPLTG